MVEPTFNEIAGYWNGFILSKLLFQSYVVLLRTSGKHFLKNSKSKGWLKKEETNKVGKSNLYTDSN